MNRSCFEEAFGLGAAVFDLVELPARFIRNVYRIAADPEHRGCLATNSAAELLPGAGELADFMTLVLGHSRSMIEEKVRWAVEDGELPAGTDPAAFALAIQNLMLGVNLQSKIVHDEAALWASCVPALSALGLLSNDA